MRIVSSRGLFTHWFHGSTRIPTLTWNSNCFKIKTLSLYLWGVNYLVKAIKRVAKQNQGNSYLSWACKWPKFSSMITLMVFMNNVKFNKREMPNNLYKVTWEKLFIN